MMQACRRGRDEAIAIEAGRMAGVRRAFAVVSLLLGLAGAASAATTPAGTVIQASAEVSFVIGSVPLTVRSNAPALSVDQLIDVAIVPMIASVPVRAAETGRSVAFRVVNTGNAPESVHLALATAVAGNGFDAIPHSPSIFLDTDASGSLTPADAAYAPGGNDPVLAPGASAVVLAVVDVPSGLAVGAHSRLEFDAHVTAGAAAPGTVFGATGPNGVDAITGLSGGAAHATSELLVSGVDVALLKSATVTATDGSSSAEPGARIDYDIAVQVTGAGLVHGLLISDPIPASTHYIPASVQLDGIAQSDVAAFQSAAGQIQVSLGDVPAGAVHHVRFSVLIN
jgi:uncharacterized repeat protein (TIGR01451 family)